MVFRSKLPLFLFLFIATLALAQMDPQQQYQQCQSTCQEQQPQQQQECLQQCEEERQRQQGDQQVHYEQCQQVCEKEGDGPWQCKEHCETNALGHHHHQQQQSNPYFLGEEMFREKFRTEQGYAIQSPRFNEISNLLRGIENYHVAFLEANPSTFMIPHHVDAETVFFVVRGRGTLSIIQQPNKESYNLKSGDVIRVPAGSMYYLINRDNKEKFQLVSLFQVISTPPDSFRDFFAVGGQNPESFFNVFSDEILEAAFNVPRQRLAELFGKQRQGVIVKASQEQIQALTRDASSSGEGSPGWSRHGGSQCTGPSNVFNQHPTASNEYGQLYRVDASKSEQLRDLDVEVAYYNIKKGAMVAPFYNSQATSLVLVIGGKGRFEMACPHLSSSQSQGRGRSQQEEGGSAHYQRVSAELSSRTAFIIPAGHPVSIIASDNQDMTIVAYKLNAQNNQRNYLAGQNNMLNELEKEAKELSFNMPAKEVDAILNNQMQSVFLPGPSQRQQGQGHGQGRHSYFLEMVGNVMAF